jgi:ATP-dependent RNA helicase RhlB
MQRDDATYFTETDFSSLEIPDELRRSIADLGFEQLTDVQDEVLPLVLQGQDVVVQAQTGSGKTATYLLAIFTRLLTVPRASPPTTPRALIVAPTRELAVQIAADANDLAQHTELSVHVVFGGVDYHKQRDELRAGVDLLVGTPGRLIDYHRQGVYDLRDTEIVVVDECDRLFDMGFADDLRWILRRLPSPGRRHSMMFTATLSIRVATLGWREMNNPTEVVINPEAITPETITQELYHVSSREKLSLLLGVLDREGCERTMIFVNTKVQGHRLAESLRRHGYHVRLLSGNVAQRKRLRVIEDFRDGQLPILVATDVASRGLHIAGVSHVINYDLPQDPEDYVHRVGRTARVGAEGKAISLACDDYVYSLDAVQEYIGYEIPVVFPPSELFYPVKPRPHHPSGSKKRRPQGSRTPRRKPTSDSAEEATRSSERSGTQAPGTPAPDSKDTKPRRRRRPRRRRKKRQDPSAEPTGSGTPSSSSSDPTG